MKTIEIARRMAQLGETKEALRAYALVLNGDAEPAEHLEAAAYTLQNGGDYKIAYTTFVELHRAGCFRDDIFALMTQAFYAPNISLLKGRYERNRKLLAGYPYLFRKDFVPFDELPLKFYPYDDHNGYVPFDTRTGEFGDFVNVRDPAVSRNFFQDLEKPVLASDVYSQYELEYLNDNVRPSEWCARENHIYLHYTDWTEFCCWLQVLNVKPLVGSKKAVFLIGDEQSEYPIDFKERFGIDYSRFTPRPVGIREVNRLIWHTQLAAHNGGDFFNEIFDDHPNLISISSIMFSTVEDLLATTRKQVEDVRAEIRAGGRAPKFGKNRDSRVVEQLCRLKDLTDKDLLVATYMRAEGYNNEVDPTSRIAPALLFQPHFHNIVYGLESNDRGDAVLDCKEAEALRECAWLRQFKYIKTFTPLRRPTASHGGTVRFMRRRADAALETPPPGKENATPVVPDAVAQRVLNRSYLRDPDDRMYHDAVIVRFEDGKLNPEATFTRLAAFLDLPYTESMTYCSEKGVHDPQEFDTNAVGFDPSAVYNTYDEYVNDDERRFIEFFLRDVYEYYGYDFQTYDGAPADMERVKEWIGGFDVMNRHMRESWQAVYRKIATNIKPLDGGEIDEETRKKAEAGAAGKMLDDFMKRTDEARLRIAEIMLGGLRFINRRGQPLQMTPLLEPDPALLKMPLYR